MGAKQQILYYLLENFNILWKIFEKIEKFSRQGRRPKPKNPAQWHCATSGINNIIFLAKRIIINNWKYMVYKYLFLRLYHIFY